MSLICSVCQSHHKEETLWRNQGLEGEGDSYESLWSKIQFIGFVEVDDKIHFLENLCMYCAMRVEDAYALKLQCLASGRMFQEKRTSSVLKGITETSSVLEEAVLAVTNTMAECSVSNSLGILTIPFPEEVIKETTVSALSLIASSAHDMFACIQNLSTTLKLNMALLSEAIHFMENTLSLLTVLLPFKNETSAMLKSAQTIRSEAESWKIKSGIMSDATSFVREVSSSTGKSVVSSRSKCESSVLKKKRLESNFSNKSRALDIHITLSPSSSPIPSQDDNSAPDSSSVSFSRKEKDQNKNRKHGHEIGGDREFTLYEDTQSVRRSIRSRSVVDHLMYWPSSRKLCTSQSKSQEERSCKKLSDTPMSSSEALDSLFLKREMESDPENLEKSTKDEKWSIIKKRKVSKNQVNESRKEKSRWKFKIKPRSSTGSSGAEEGSTTDGTPPEKDFKITGVISEGSQKVCQICDKVLSSSRNLHAHMQMHTGSSPYKCNYCSKVFSSGWNRVQHERVHTGEKPYVCNICEEAFRYNVSLRHHTKKFH